MTLTVIVVRTGAVLDVVTLDAGELRYSTGAARDVFEAPRARNANLSDAELFESRAGWSNGYLRVAVS